MCFSPCGEKIASGGGDRYGNEDYSIRIWDAKTGEQIGSPLRGHSHRVNSVCWNNDGTKLASGSSDETVKIWNPATGECLWTLSGHSNCVRSVSWSPDGAKLASGSDDKTVRIWEVATGKELSQLKAHSDWVRAVAWSPCGQWLASGGDGKMVFVFDTKTFEVKWPLSCDSTVLSIDWHENRIVSGCYDNTIKVFDTQSGDRLSTVKGHRYVLSVCLPLPDFFICKLFFFKCAWIF